jgi:CBS domain containing-hemolysin-like protein
MSSSDGVMSDLVGVLAVLVLVVANGFFVAAEFSLVTVRRSRVARSMRRLHPVNQTQPKLEAVK